MFNVALKLRSRGFCDTAVIITVSHSQQEDMYFEKKESSIYLHRTLNLPTQGQVPRFSFDYGGLISPSVL